jgi:hypothetical protein
VKLKRLNVDVIEHVEAQQLDLSALIKSNLPGSQLAKEIVIETIDRFYNERFK